MLADAALAVVLLGALSYARFGSDWIAIWEPLFAEPAAFALLYAGGWVVVLWLHGLYRPRARWSLRSEGVAIARSVVVMALVIEAIRNTVSRVIAAPPIVRVPNAPS